MNAIIKKAGIQTLLEKLISLKIDIRGKLAT